jgi:hypothetical protein
MKKKCLFVAGLLAVAGSLQAATVTNTFSVVMGTDQDVTASLAKFNSNLGTLTAIYLEYVAQIDDAYIQIDNDAAYSQTARAIASSAVNSFSTSVRRDGAGIEDDDARLAVYKSKLFTLGATSGDTVGMFNATGASDYTNWNSGTVKSTIIGGYVDSSVFSDYTADGNGTFYTYINSTILASASVGSTTYYSGNSPTGTFTGKVIYDYTAAIPEPASVSMAVLVVLAGFWIRRRFAE